MAAHPKPQRVGGRCDVCRWELRAWGLQRLAESQRPSTLSTQRILSKRSYYYCYFYCILLFLYFLFKRNSLRNNMFFSLKLKRKESFSFEFRSSFWPFPRAALLKCPGLYAWSCRAPWGAEEAKRSTTKNGCPSSPRRAKEEDNSWLRMEIDEIF